MIDDNDDVDGDDDGNAMHCGDGFTHSQITSLTTSSSGKWTKTNGIKVFQRIYCIVLKKYSEKSMVVDKKLKTRNGQMLI